MAFSYSPKIVTDGLVLYLDAANPYSYVSGSTNWNDLSKTQVSGSLINGPTFDTGSGGSVVFDGVNDYVSIGNVDLSATPKITISFWCQIINYRQVSGSANIVAEITPNFNASTTGLYIAYGEDSNPAFGGTFPISLNIKGDVGYNIFAYNKTAVNDLKWHYWTCLFDKTASGSTPQESNLYIDGVFQTFTLNPSGFRSDNTNNFGNQPLFLGARSGGTVAPANIRMSNFCVHSKLLSTQEILQNYNATKGRFGL